MQIIQTNAFGKVAKKLHSNQKEDLDKAIEAVIENTDIGIAKTGDLSGVRIYKFKMVNQLMLMAYIYENDILTLTLLGLGAHENFYRDLKNSLN